MNETTTNAYAKRINKVCDYILSHLGEDLSVEQLSEIACFSKFHFHRQFTDYTGITVFKFIQLMRLKQASYQLAFNPQYRILDIALDAKFESPESFSRAFKKAFGQTPSQFRTQPAWGNWIETYHFKTSTRIHQMDIKIIDFKETKVAVLEHRGSPNLVNESVSTFITWRKQSLLSPITTSDTFGLAYDDPATASPEKFRFDICGSVNAKVPENPQGVINKTIPGGRCAVLRHLGSLDTISESVHFMYGKWLPTSGEELRDFPCFFHYRNLITEVREHELITDIHLPLI